MDLCRHEVRYGCQREDSCFYAHSLIELKVWMMQSKQGELLFRFQEWADIKSWWETLTVVLFWSISGITHEGIVQESQKYWNMDSAVQAQELPPALRRFGPANLKMQFVCAQCWRNGQVSEPDKNKKYCSAKARHPWVLLISSSKNGNSVFNFLLWNTKREMFIVLLFSI